MIIRQAVPEDLDAIVNIEKACFPDPWSRESFARDIAENEFAYLAVLEAEGLEALAGYADMTCILGEANIDSIAVVPEARGRGLGEALLSHMIDRATGQGCYLMMLEVRRSNEAAISLYKKHGFEEIGVRRGYYADNGEDAILMNKELPE